MSTIVTATEFMYAMRSISASDLRIFSNLVKEYPTLLSMLEENFNAKSDYIKNPTVEKKNKILANERNRIVSALNNDI